jgi:hypothetical protein
MEIARWLVDKVLPTKLQKLKGEEFIILILLGAFVAVMLFVVYYDWPF